jgi:hypothetical protein
MNVELVFLFPSHLEIPMLTYLKGPPTLAPESLSGIITDHGDDEMTSKES